MPPSWGVSVLPEHRGQGIGTALFERAVEMQTGNKHVDAEKSK